MKNRNTFISFKLRDSSLRLLACLLALCAFHPGSTQENVKEHISIHLSHDLLITGETLYYSANVVSSNTRKFSDLSGILYVELINSKGEPIHRAKDYIIDGKASGDIFITSLISTGPYQLIAYTRWMRNFGDFYHHSLQIINPFETYNIPEATTDLTVNFYPEGGNLVTDQPNRVVAEVLNHMDERQRVKGRLVDDEGTVLSTLSTDELGLISFEITPGSGKKYQMILEDETGNFQFFDLPKAAPDTYALQVNFRSNSLEVRLNGKSESRETQIRIFHGTDEVLDQHVLTNRSVLIPKDQLPHGASLVLAEINDQKVSERIIFIHPEFSLDRENNEPVFSPRSFISVPLEFDANTTTSISVRRLYAPKSDQLGMRSLDLLYGIDNLSDFQDRYLTDKKYTESLDRLIIASKWKLGTADSKTKVRLLPDHRGEIVSGRLILPDSIEYSDQRIAYSLIGKDYQVKVSDVGQQGYFSMILTPFEEDREAFITSLDGLNGEWIEVDQPFLSDVPDLSFPLMYLDTASLRQLVDRSIRNQIENAYFQLKADSIQRKPPYPEEFGQFENFYVLDNFNRFPTLRDSFVEYIPTVAARKKGDHYVFKVSPKYYLDDPELESMVFLDGLPVGSDEILAFSPYRIESIGVINNRYFMGPLIADGIISFRTKEGDLHGFTPGINSKPLKYKGLSPAKTYTFPMHSDSEPGEANLSSRIPDYRDQLYWVPEVRVPASGKYDLKFFTSDTKGQFEIIAEGISATGEIRTIRRYFTVE